jgi:large subunit ribosomal protein L6
MCVLLGQASASAVRSAGWRTFTTCPPLFSHIGSQPIPIPPGVQVTYPPLAIQPSLPPDSLAGSRFLTLKVPLGIHHVRISPSVVLQPSSAPNGPLNIIIHDTSEKRQKAVWGMTRTIIDNAIKGVSEGFQIELRLVGVGYRASVEAIPSSFRALLEQNMRLKAAKTGTTTSLPTERLNIKLGYADPVLIDVPTSIKVTVPAPTKIVLQGIDKQTLGLFAAQIRRWRKPEPYRGKVSTTFIRALHILTY